MEYRILGRSGIRVSAIVLGCEGFMHKNTAEVKADFDFAIDHGINFVASRFRLASIPLLTAVVMSSQLIGTLGEWTFIRFLIRK